MDHHQNGNEGQQGGAEQMQVIMEAAKPEHHHHQQQPARRCPRCNSNNTKFCYYNNYIQSQPRYFCKDCRRYWTHGGSLRNVPIGGSSHKYKRPSRPHASPPSTSPQPPSAQLIVPSPLLLTSSLTSPCHYPTSFYGGSGGAGFFSSWVGLQSMNQMPETLSSNLGNLLHLYDQKPIGLTGLLPPGAGSSTTMAAGIGGPQSAQDNSDLKLDHEWINNLGNVGGSHDN